MAGKLDHEWDRLSEAVVGIAPAEDFVVFHGTAQRWLDPAVADFCRDHAGQRLADIDPALANRIETQADGLADLLKREGIKVHRPERLVGAARTFAASQGEGTQLFVRDPLIVVAQHLIEASLRLQCRQRERFGLRPLVQTLAARKDTSWSSVPLGSPGAVDGPFLEGGDVLLNGGEVYIGMSGCASDMAGVDWLDRLLGESHRVVPIALRSHVLHLDWTLALIRPGLLLYCPANMIDGLPGSLRSWDKIEISAEECRALSANVLVLDQDRVVVEASNQRIADALRQHRVEVIPLPFDGALRFGGGLRSACRPLARESVAL